MRRSFVVALALLAIAFAFVGGPSLFTSPSTSEVAPESDPEAEIYTPEGSESGFWPYLNSRQSLEKRSPINVVVRGNATEIVRLMTTESEREWTETDESEEEAGPLTHSVQPVNESNVTAEPNASPGPNASPSANPAASTNETNVANGAGAANETTEPDTIGPNPTEIPWAQATGATRYAYVDPGPDGDPYWTTETLQLHDGDYYGYRYHIRLYESPNPDDEWVAMQTHSEHFDWLTLRHRVDGVEAAQTRLEADFVALESVDERENVSRINLGNAGPSDANGWATFVELVSVAVGTLVVGLAAGGDALGRAREAVTDHLTEADRRRLEALYARLEARHLMLAATIVALVLGVRIGGITLERGVDSLSMHAIAALLYPFVGVGIPLSTYLLARGLERRLDAAVVASVSLAAAIWLDYGLLGVDSLPIDVVLQRMLIVVAIGLVAAGATHRATRESRANGLLVAGTAMWVLVLVATLFGYL